jgi:hypothetical protein
MLQNAEGSNNEIWKKSLTKIRIKITRISGNKLTRNNWLNKAYLHFSFSIKFDFLAFHLLYIILFLMSKVMNEEQDW